MTERFCCVKLTTQTHPRLGGMIKKKIRVMLHYRLRWSRGSVLAFGTQVRGFKPDRSRRIFKGEKIFSTPSFGGEVKPSVPCRRFAACKRSLELRESRILDEICRNISRPRRVPPSVARGLSLAEVGTSKGGEKQWQPTPKNLPRMQFWFLLKLA